MTDHHPAMNLSTAQRTRFAMIAKDAAKAAIEFTLDPRTPHIAFFAWNAHCFNFDLSIRESEERYFADVWNPDMLRSPHMYWPEIDASLDQMQEVLREFRAECDRILAGTRS